MRIKHVWSILILFFLTGLAFGQESERDAKLTQKINKSAQKLEKDLDKQYRKGEIEFLVYKDSELEMFKIDEWVRLKLEEDASPRNYIYLLIQAEEKYQVLIDKYYNILMAKIKPEHKKSLEDAHEAWKLWMSFEREMNKTLNDTSYDPEAADLEISAEAHLQLTKNRVYALIEYIARLSKE